MNAVVDQLRPASLLIPTSLLAQCELLAQCSAEELSQMQALVKRHRFTRGKHIITEGDHNRSLWMLLEGTCEVLKEGQGSTEQQLAIIESGGVFGEMSFLEPAPHSATVRALTNVEVAQLSIEAFEELRTASPTAAYSILSRIVLRLSDRLRQMDERVCELLVPAPEERKREWHDFRTRLFAGWDFQ